jgi:hypothetical protein
MRLIFVGRALFLMSLPTVCGGVNAPGHLTPILLLKLVARPVVGGLKRLPSKLASSFFLFLAFYLFVSS